MLNPDMHFSLTVLMQKTKEHSQPQKNNNNNNTQNPFQGKY